MKKSLILIFLIHFVIKSNSQDLTFKDLVLIQSKKFEFINSYLIKKNWEFYTSEKIDSTLNMITWENNLKSERIVLYDDLNKENTIILVTSKNNLEKIKNDLNNAGFKFFDQKVLDNAFIITYRNEMLEFALSTKKMSQSMNYYGVVVSNFIELEKIKEKEIKLKQEENERIRQEEIKQLGINDLFRKLMFKADTLYDLQNYNEALRLYMQADTLEYRYHVKERIKEIKDLYKFLDERNLTIFDYKLEDEIGYKRIEAFIQESLMSWIIKNNYNNAIDIAINCYIDTSSLVTIDIAGLDKSEDILKRHIESSILNQNLKSLKKYGYTVNSKMSFDFNCFTNTSSITVRKIKIDKYEFKDDCSNDLQSEIKNYLDKYDKGKYVLLINKIVINYKIYTEIKILIGNK